VVEAQSPTATPNPVLPIFPTAAPTEKPPPSNATAVALLQRSDEAMNQLKGLRVEHTSEGQNDGIWRYAAPDRRSVEGYRGDWLESHTIVIGADYWSLYGFTEDRSWTYSRSKYAFRWPTYFRGHYQKTAWIEWPVSVQLEGEERIDNRLTWHVSYVRRYASDHGGWITEYWQEWIDQENHLLLQSQIYDDDDLGNPGAVYTMHYSDFEETFEIVWPAAFATSRQYLPMLRRPGP